MLLQQLINIISSFFVYSLISLSFSIIYSSVRFFQFVQALIFTLGAYFAFTFTQILGVSLYISIPLSVLCATIVGCLFDIISFRRLRGRKASSKILFLTSLGIYISSQNIVSMIFGDNIKSIRNWPVIEGMNIFQARITPIQLIILFTSTIIILVVNYLLFNFQMGKASRAIASDSGLATISGINNERVILFSYVMGFSIAAIIGILVALDVDMYPTMGMNALLMGVVAMVIGGVGSIPGVIIGSLLLSTAQHISIIYFNSQWLDTVAFTLLLFFLLFKPEGIKGTKSYKYRL